MKSFEDLAKAIIKKFEDNLPIPIPGEKPKRIIWSNDEKEVRLYLAAKNYMDDDFKKWLGTE